MDPSRAVLSLRWSYFHREDKVASDRDWWKTRAKTCISETVWPVWILMSESWGNVFRRCVCSRNLMCNNIQQELQQINMKISNVIFILPISFWFNKRPWTMCQLRINYSKNEFTKQIAQDILPTFKQPLNWHQ